MIDGNGSYCNEAERCYATSKWFATFLNTKNLSDDFVNLFKDGLNVNHFNNNFEDILKSDKYLASEKIINSHVIVNNRCRCSGDESEPLILLTKHFSLHLHKSQAATRSLFRQMMGTIADWSKKLLDLSIEEKYKVLGIGFDSGRREISVTYEMTSDNISKQTVINLPNDGDDKYYFWNTLLYFSIMRFFASGGGGMYKFCEHCGKYFATKRAGRHYFCSATCRVYDFRGKSVSSGRWRCE